MTAGAQAFPSVSARTGDPGDFRRSRGSRFGRTAPISGSSRASSAARRPGGVGVPGEHLHDRRAGRPAAGRDGRGGNFVISWSCGAPGRERSGVMARRFDASGQPRPRVHRQHATRPGPRTRRTSPSDPFGNFVVAWRSAGQDGSLSGSSPSASGACIRRAGGGSGRQRRARPRRNSGGRPSWQNLNGAAQTFGGNLALYSGRGRHVAISDSTAGYGTVANGATAACSDCYAVSRGPVHASAALGLLRGRDHRARQPGTAEAVDLPRGRQLRGRAEQRRFYRFVETMLHNGITTGCSPTRYCPLSSTSREQMAVFVLVAKEGAGYVAACLHDADLQRRAGEQSLLPLDRGAGAAGRGERMWRRQLLPDRVRHARADGGIRAARAGPGAQPARVRARRCSTTFLPPALSAVGSRSWSGAASSPAAAAATTARPRP